MSISIALCTHNGERFLREQLESLVSQTRQPDELVVFDDVSTDSTLAILESFRTNAPFEVRLHQNQTNLGSTANFGRAIEHCQGETIVLCDQDDVWQPHKLETLVGGLEQYPQAAFAISNATRVDEELKPLGYDLWDAIDFGPRQRTEFASEWGYRLMLRRWVATGATMAFRAEYRELLLPIPRVWVHDGWIALLLRTLAACLVIEEPLMLYRQHSGQQIGERKRSLFAQYRIARQMGLDEYLRVRDMFTAARARLWEQARDRVSPGVFEELDRKIEHADARVRMRESRWRRLPLVGREWTKGNYQRYSLGWKSLAQDLFLP